MNNDLHQKKYELSKKIEEGNTRVKLFLFRYLFVYTQENEGMSTAKVNFQDKNERRQYGTLRDSFIFKITGNLVIVGYNQEVLIGKTLRNKINAYLTFSDALIE